MHVVEGVSIGISAIRGNQLRSSLMMLGIIIGIVAILAMIAIGDGAKTLVLDEVERFGGANMFKLYYNPWRRVGNRWVRHRHNEYFRYEDALAIEAECPSVGSIAGFSLLVGGIGIMNMMLVAVNERTREIGLRKAVGAKSRDILLQFLSEAVVMCTIGGTIGVGLGILAGEGMAVLAVKIVKIVPEWPAVISWQWVLISVSFSAIIGISFGLYPAMKAATLPPIEALRKD